MNENIKHVASGKVREIYCISDEKLAIVTTDRISAYDVILDDIIPDKGLVLNKLSNFWMELFSDLVPNHLVSSIDEDLYELSPTLGDSNWLKGRTVIVRKAKMFPIECIVRGYLFGSAWREYKSTGRAVGLDLPKNLQLADKLPYIVFTPSTKVLEGHDENIDIEKARNIVGSAIDELSRISIELYCRAAAYAEERGIIIADTKFEFGIINDKIILADEVLTPDSSRFWYKKDWVPGTNPPSLDKQIVRDWLDSNGWNHSPPAPHLSSNIIQSTQTRYLELHETLLGQPLR
jgi:phosphoribosylaminoimidazole-succinocarboxamide synthase